MTIGWVITQSNLSGVSEFLKADDDNSENGWSWSTAPKKATIFMDKEQVDEYYSLVQNPKTSVEIIPVEIHY